MQVRLVCDFILFYFFVFPERTLTKRKMKKKKKIVHTHIQLTDNPQRDVESGSYLFPSFQQIILGPLINGIKYTRTIINLRSSDMYE